MENEEHKRIQSEVYEKMMKIEMKRAVDFFNSSIALCAIIMIEGGIIKAVNKRFLEELGYEYIEVIGEPWIKFVWPEDQEISKKEEEMMLADNRGTVRFINRWRRKDGEPVIFQWKTQTDKESGLYFCVIDVLKRCLTERDRICHCGMNSYEACWRGQKREVGGLKLI